MSSIIKIKGSDSKMTEKYKNKKNSKLNMDNTHKENNEIEKTFGMKVLTFLGVVVSLATCLYLMNYFFVKKSYIKINISTDKRVDNIKISDETTSIITQKYVSDLGYNMRYDISTFKVFKYKSQDMFKYLDAEKILIIVEKGIIPSNCSTPGDEIYNSCMIIKDDFTKEYYITENGKTFKITVKTPGANDYKEEIKARINYILNSFEITK